MKAKFKIFQLFIAISGLSVGMISCVTDYRTISTVRSDGSIFREIYAKGDSAFLAGDKTKNPYFFQLDSGWQITVLNEKNTGELLDKYNVKINKLFHTTKEISSELRFDEDYRPLAAPAESFQKHFRWFYTYYSYKTVYQKFSDKISIPVDEYLNVAEQKLWFQGDFSGYSGMNGIELKEEMDKIEQRFWKWYARNIYEIRFEVIMDYEKNLSGRYVSKIQEVKDTVFENLFKNFDFAENDSFETANLYITLDKHFNINYFSGLYRDNRLQIDGLMKEKEKYLENLIDKLFNVEIEYQLIMPGKLIYANAPVQYQDTLIWKVNAFRFVSNDYVLTAESRTTHVWAFVVTFLLLALSVCCLVLKSKT
jgi:hypothetical protein